MKIRYIPSALDSAGSFLVAHSHYPKLAVQMLVDLKTQEPDIDIGVLANAYSEPKDLEEFHNILRPRGVKVYSDSGGLQVITIGAEITPELKKDIYHRQAMYSDFALSFDEIPKSVLSRSNSNSSFGLDDVWVDEWFKKKAIESGQNIAEQIRAFKKDPACTSKILFIIQAKNFEAAREWSWFMLQEIKKEPDYEKYIGGLALGSTPAGGPRYLADFLLRFQKELDFLPLEWRKKVHILGAGSVSRIISSLVVPDSYFLPGTIITADSTTQTRAMIFGNFLYFNEKSGKLQSLSPGRTINKDSLEVVDHIYKYVKPYMEKFPQYKFIPKNVDDFRNHYSEYNDTLTRLKVDFTELHEDPDEAQYEYRKRARISRFFWSMTMISHFIKFMESIRTNAQKYRDSDEEGKAEVLKIFKGALPTRLYKPSVLLMNIHTHREYMEGTEVLSGHPYSEVLPIELVPKIVDSLVEYQGQTYVTDEYQGELLGRILITGQANKNPITPDSKRNMILSFLPGITIDTLKTLNQEAQDELDAW